MDRTELGRFLFSAEHLGGRRPTGRVGGVARAGLNGLRVSESCETDIGDLGFDRGHRTLRIVGKGSKPTVIPLVPRTSRSADLAIGERREGPILLRHDGQRLDRRTAHRRVRRSASGPAWVMFIRTCSGERSSWRFSAVVRLSLHDVQLAARLADPRTTTIYDRRHFSETRRCHHVAVRSRLRERSGCRCSTIWLHM